LGCVNCFLSILLHARIADIAVKAVASMLWLESVFLESLFIELVHRLLTGSAHLILGTGSHTPWLDMGSGPSNSLCSAHVLANVTVDGGPAPSQIFLSGSSDPTSEHRTLDLHVDPIKRIHYSFDPVLVNLREELFNGLLSLR